MWFVSVFRQGLWAAGEGARFSRAALYPSTKPTCALLPLRRLTSGCQPAPRPPVTRVTISMTRLAIDMVSACASVLGDDEVDALQSGRDHVVDDIAAGAPTPNTMMSAFISQISFMLAICASRCSGKLEMRGQGLLPASLAVCLHYACG
jgi:hypothetical protein